MADTVSSDTSSWFSDILSGISSAANTVASSYESLVAAGLAKSQAPVATTNPTAIPVPAQTPSSLNAASLLAPASVTKMVEYALAGAVIYLIWKKAFK